MPFQITAWTEGFESNNCRIELMAPVFDAGGGSEGGIAAPELCQLEIADCAASEKSVG